MVTAGTSSALPDHQRPASLNTPPPQILRHATIIIYYLIYGPCCPTRAAQIATRPAILKAFVALMQRPAADEDGQGGMAMDMLHTVSQTAGGAKAIARAAPDVVQHILEWVPEAKAAQPFGPILLLLMPEEHQRQQQMSKRGTIELLDAVCAEVPAGAVLRAVAAGHVGRALQQAMQTDDAHMLCVALLVGVSRRGWGWES